jgi:hypothetical protein
MPLMRRYLPRPLVRRYRGLYAERRMGHEGSVLRYDDDGCPVITNEKVASSSVDRLGDPSYHPPNLISFVNADGGVVKI